MPGPESLHANGREADAEDVRLMRRVSKGESAAFEELIERHQALVSGTVALAATTALVRPAAAATIKPYSWDLNPPTDTRENFIAWTRTFSLVPVLERVFKSPAGTVIFEVYSVDGTRDASGAVR